MQVKVGHLRQVVPSALAFSFELVAEGTPVEGADLDQFLGNLDAVNPGVERILTSARTSQGMDEWCSWLERRKPA